MNYNIDFILPFSQRAKSKVVLKSLSASSPDDKTLEYFVYVLNQILSGNIKFNETEYMDSVYPYSRIVLSIINKPSFYEKFSDFYYNIVLLNAKEHELEYLDLLGIKYDFNKVDFLIDAKDYTYAKIKSEKDKLINKTLKSGYVYLSKDECINFIGRYVSTKVIHNLPLKLDDVSSKFTDIAKMFDAKYTIKRKSLVSLSGPYDISRVPPCMIKIMDDLESGGKPSHIARYYLATFMYSINMDTDSIVDVFAKGAEYKEDVTKYQLSKIKGYAPPMCQTVKSMGLCFENEFCSKIKSPTEYYYKLKLSKKSSNSDASNDN